MIWMLFDGQIAFFASVFVAIVFALSFHEFGHAYMAYRLGDDTAARLGRLSVNPAVHIDPLGLLMVVIVGFGWAKPVPFDPRKLESRWGPFLVAAAGPFVNLVLATIAVNVIATLGADADQGLVQALALFAYINTLLMLFNLIPLGPLDGHYILPELLPEGLARAYRDFNRRYGSQLILVLVLASVAGLNTLGWLQRVADRLMWSLQIL